MVHMDRGEKHCSSCKKWRLLEEFPKDKNGDRGRRWQCNLCRKVYHRSAKGRELKNKAQKRHSTLHPDRIRERNAAWKAKHPDYFRRYRFQYENGITLEKFEEMLASQDGGCAICGASTTDSTGRRLCVDHDHQTQEVRGLLCRKCNFGLADFNDSPYLLERAAEYLLGVIDV